MAEKLDRARVAELAIIHAAPLQRAPMQVDRSFELPGRIYAGTVGLFLTYLAIMAAGFPHPEMILPMSIFVLFIVAAFGVPALWVRMKPDNPTPALSWDRFRHDGIVTGSGHLTSGEATVQVLLMPALIVFWGLCVVTIAAFAR